MSEEWEEGIADYSTVNHSFDISGLSRVRLSFVLFALFRGHFPAVSSISNDAGGWRFGAGSVGRQARGGMDDGLSWARLQRR